mmetsp:Transcript_7269/g.20632  ORF Transcript_7269/g.20632 Transcript_7269/m.20632 type:complete len:261 (+) Transcript_7269:1398-2180(+)
MDVHDRQQDLPHHFRREHLREEDARPPRGADLVLQLTPRAEVHDQIDRGLVLEALIQLGNVRVIDEAQILDLGLQQLEAAAEARLLNNLHGPARLCALLPDELHLTVGAAAERRGPLELVGVHGVLPPAEAVMLPGHRAAVGVAHRGELLPEGAHEAVEVQRITAALTHLDDDALHRPACPEQLVHVGGDRGKHFLAKRGRRRTAALARGVAVEERLRFLVDAPLAHHGVHPLEMRHLRPHAGPDDEVLLLKPNGLRLYV